MVDCQSLPEAGVVRTNFIFTGTAEAALLLTAHLQFFRLIFLSEANL